MLNVESGHLDTRAGGTGDALIAVVLLQMRSRQVGADTVVIAGADQIPEERIEELLSVAGACNTWLVFLFEHLRDDALRLIGTGSEGVMFMRRRRKSQGGCGSGKLHRHGREVEEHSADGEYVVEFYSYARNKQNDNRHGRISRARLQCGSTRGRHI